MAEFPSFPLWTDAYLADTGHLTDAEHGRYLLILIHLWRTPLRRFPNDLSWLARKFRRSQQDVENELLPIMREFMRTDGNWWTQKRLDAEWTYLEKQAKQRSVAAKARWNKEKSASDKDASPHNSRSAPTPTPTPTPSKKEEIKKPNLVSREKVNGIVAKSISAIQHNGAGGATYDDPRVRKQRWEQKIIDELNHRLPPANVKIVVEAYANGDAEAKKLFDDIGNDIRRRQSA